MADKFSNQFFLSCDWGTTTLRLKLIKMKTGKPTAVTSDSNGIKIINNQWSEYSGKSNRLNYFLSILRKKISLLENQTQQKLENVPVMISGMASSSIGIKELPYAALPVSLSNPELHIEPLKASDHFPHNLYLISGLKTDEDIMRGEEIQLIGLAEKYGIQNGIYILPGTHSKHVYVRNNIIQDFKTYLTGELFELLISGSILANSILKPNESFVSEAFHNGIETSLSENLLHALFKIRAGDLLHGSKRGDNYDFLSGLLIGAEMAELRKSEAEQIILGGDNQLQDYYSAACDYLEFNYFEADSSVDITALGHRMILNKIRKQN